MDSLPNESYFIAGMCWGALIGYAYVILTPVPKTRYKALAHLLVSGPIAWALFTAVSFRRFAKYLTTKR